MWIKFNASRRKRPPKSEQKVFDHAHVVERWPESHLACDSQASMLIFVTIEESPIPNIIPICGEEGLNHLEEEEIPIRRRGNH